MNRQVILIVVTLLFSGIVSGQQVAVFPAVTDLTPGKHNSIWGTEIQIIKMNPLDHLTVKRLWVCLPDGGFLENPDEALTWELFSNQNRILQLKGEDLLFDTESDRGAVALQIEGGDFIATSRVMDVMRGVYRPPAIFGQGQLIPGIDEPLIGSSHLPWLGGCSTARCSEGGTDPWNFYRNNIGLINPNPTPMEITGVLIPFGTSGGPPAELDQDVEPETFTKQLPAYGWLQFNLQPDHLYGYDMFGGPIPAITGFIVSLTPNSELPYYAYGSVVFAPNPETEVPEFNDPMYIPAEPGYFTPVSELSP
ncbi:MAG: hypothetical protein DRH08_02415 [Deltaproteobacteria bacterium]|nr:MAG: hypothetical protein DRH08_02415 [Deltaproteobacteria bacterium]